MSKQQYIPIELDGVRIGTGQIQNHHLVLSIPDKNLRALFWGEAEDLKLESISLETPGLLKVDRAKSIKLHTKESSNNNG